MLLLVASETYSLSSTSVLQHQREAKKLVREARKQTRAGLFEKSETTLRRALELDELRSETRVELAFVLTKLRRIREAYDLVFPVAESEPKNARAYAVLGTTMLTAGRFKEARIFFHQAIRINRREDLAWAGYGTVDFYENRISESLANLREATFHQPDEPDHLFTLAQVSARAELYDDAAYAYTRFLQVSKVTDADRRARIKGLIEFLRFLGKTGTLYQTSGTEQTEVNFELEGNRPVISLRLDDHPQPLRFVLDTGSGISVLSEKTAKRLKIKPITRGGHARGLGGDGKFEIVYGLLREIGIGKIGVRNVPVYIRKFHDSAREVDGYIGLSLISKFLTTVDYGRQTFNLTRRDEDNRAFRQNPESSFPLRLTSSGFLSGEVSLDGFDIPLNFIVDTGASVSVISDELSRTEAISPFGLKNKMRVVGSAGITDNVPSFLLPRVAIGGHSRADITAVALDLGIINEASGFEQAGILGGNFLNNYRVTFDFRNSRVTLVPVRTEKD